MKMIRLCADYDAARMKYKTAADVASSAEASRLLDDARKAIEFEVDTVMQTLIRHDFSKGAPEIRYELILSYFNTWMIRKGGWV